MPPTKFANLSIPDTVKSYLVREFQKLDHKVYEMSFAQWASTMLQASIKRDSLLHKIYPHIEFVRVSPNGFMLFDTKINKPVAITFDKQKLTCSEHKDRNCDHITYSTIHPLFKV